MFYFFILFYFMFTTKSTCIAVVSWNILAIRKWCRRI